MSVLDWINPIGMLAKVFLGSDPLGTAISGLNKAYSDKLTAQTAAQQSDANVRITMGEQQVRILQNANAVRLATAGHWEQRLLTFIAGGTAILHWACIGIGTTFAVPLGWQWLDWAKHIPPFPEPFATYEGSIILSYFGLVGAVSVGKSIAGALALKGTANVTNNPPQQ